MFPVLVSGIIVNLVILCGMHNAECFTCLLFQFILTTTLVCRQYYYLHFTEETETHRDEVIAQLK